MNRPDDVPVMDRFPDENPNPVVRILPDGTLLYANPASRLIVSTWAVAVGSKIPPDQAQALVAAAAEGRAVETMADHRTFSLLPVDVPDLGFLNVYGTDVTAQRAIEKFPDQNPNPVFRFRRDGTLAYANPASTPIIEALGCAVGRVLSVQLLEPLLDQVNTSDTGTLEIAAGPRTYSLKAIDVPAFGFINVYGTDITAARELAIAHRDNERLLLNILPEPVARRLRTGETLIADRYDDVTMMFADIVEFTRISAGLSPSELVTVLNDVFTAFDDLVGRYDLEKVKTIGDAYMVVGGAPNRSDDHADRVASMAIELTDRVDAIRAAHNLGVRFRIGIHSGPIVAGVIGTRKFIYDVWGDTVNVASRMESLSLPGRIQVTAAVEQRLRPRFRFESRGTIEVKGKGPMPTWFLTGRVATPPS